MTGRRYLLTLRKTCCDYGVFLAAILLVWLCFFGGLRLFSTAPHVSGTIYIMGEYVEFDEMRMLASSFAGIFTVATCIYFICAGAETAKGMRNLNQMGTSKKTSLLISVSINFAFVVISALISAVTSERMFLTFFQKFLMILSTFSFCYFTTYLFNAITTFFKPLVSTIIIIALLILPGPGLFSLYGPGRLLLPALIELVIGTVLFLSRYSILKSENL